MRGIIFTIVTATLIIALGMVSFERAKVNDIRYERIQNQIEFERLTRVSKLVLLSYSKASDVNTWKQLAEQAWNAKIDLNQREFEICERHMCGKYRLIRI